jgi:hypothetical protein
VSDGRRPQWRRQHPDSALSSAARLPRCRPGPIASARDAQPIRELPPGGHAPPERAFAALRIPAPTAAADPRRVAGGRVPARRAGRGRPVRRRQRRPTRRLRSRRCAAAAACPATRRGRRPPRARREPAGGDEGRGLSRRRGALDPRQRRHRRPLAARILAQRFCRDLANPNVRQAGLAYDARDLWLVLAAPFEPPTARDAPQVARRVLELVNAARAEPRACGRQRLPAAPP